MIRSHLNLVGKIGARGWLGNELFGMSRGLCDNGLKLLKMTLI